MSNSSVRVLIKKGKLKTSNKWYTMVFIRTDMVIHWIEYGYNIIQYIWYRCIPLEGILRIRSYSKHATAKPVKRFSIDFIGNRLFYLTTRRYNRAHVRSYKKKNDHCFAALPAANFSFLDCWIKNPTNFLQTSWFMQNMAMLTRTSSYTWIFEWPRNATVAMSIKHCFCVTQMYWEVATCAKHIMHFYIKKNHIQCTCIAMKHDVYGTSILISHVLWRVPPTEAFYNFILLAQVLKDISDVN